MNKLIDFICSLSWKQWLGVATLSAAAAAACVLFSSCSLINRTSASGTRSVEKSVKQTQEWNVPSAGGPNIVTYETNTRTVSAR